MAYDKCTPPDKVQALLSFTAQVLPPLSDWDNIKLCVVLPILSIILTSESTIGKKTSHFLATSLTEFVLTRYHHSTARIAAASCIFCIIVKQPQEESNCIDLKVLVDMISPLVTAKMKALEDQSLEGIEELQDAINLLALIGSAAACRGSSSSKLANEVGLFLALLACEGTMQSSPLGIEDMIDCNLYSSDIDRKISVAASNALGSILNVKNGNPFWRQRISHLVLPIVLSSSTSFPGPRFGKLLCACHLVCCVSLPALGEKRIFGLTSLIVNGIEIFCINAASGRKDRFDQSLKIMLVSSLLKIMSDSTQAVSIKVSVFLG